VRAGIAEMSQIDPQPDEASLMLRARTFTTLRRRNTALLRPAIIAALIYAFVRAITSVSAIIFLVSADTTWRPPISWAALRPASSAGDRLFLDL